MLPARMDVILLTIRGHEQPPLPSEQQSLPKRIAEGISHRLRPPALLCREPSLTLESDAGTSIGQAPIAGPSRLKR
jgi:hypothetical protein